jgi:hypothetical protein
MSHLLSAQALTDFAAGDSGFGALANELGVEKVQLSTVAIAEVRATFAGLDKSEPDTSVLEDRLSEVVRQANASGRIRAFDLGAAERYAKLAQLHLIDEDGDHLSASTRMTLASAWQAGLIVISPAAPWEAVVTKLGLGVRTYSRDPE